MIQVVVFDNRGQHVSNAMHDANDWLSRNHEQIDVVSIDTCSSAVAFDGFATESFYITISYRVKDGDTK